VAAHPKRPSAVEEVRRRHAGLSKGLLSYHFRDKDDLMGQTARWAFAAFEESVVAGLDVTAPAPEVLRAVVHRVAAHNMAHPEQRRALDQIIRNLRRPDGSAAFSLADYESTYAAQEQLFRRGQREGDFRPFDTRVMAVTFQAAIDAMFGYTDANPDVDVERYADQLADLLLAAVAAR
jgi:AcrR family transcriptional regulator